MGLYIRSLLMFSAACFFLHLSLKFLKLPPFSTARLSFSHALAHSGRALRGLQVREEGLRGLFRGNGLNCVRVAPGKAIELCVFETVHAITGRADVAGGAAGALNTLATYPLEMLRTRVALDSTQARGGIITSLRRIARNEGPQVCVRVKPPTPKFFPEHD